MQERIRSNRRFRGPISAMGVRKPEVPRIAALALTVSVAVLMSGCGPIRYQQPLPLSIRENGDHMEVAVCEPISADRVYVGIRNLATHGKWLTLSELKGAVVIKEDSVFKVGESLPGMSSVVNRAPREPSDGEDINVNIQGEGEGDDTLTVFFAEVPWNDLDGDWFFTDGGTSSDSCAHYREFMSKR